MYMDECPYIFVIIFSSDCYSEGCPLTGEPLHKIVTSFFVEVQYFWLTGQTNVKIYVMMRKTYQIFPQSVLYF